MSSLSTNRAALPLVPGGTDTPRESSGDTVVQWIPRGLRRIRFSRESGRRQSSRSHASSSMLLPIGVIRGHFVVH
jgi:hypothetical protein